MIVLGIDPGSRRAGWGAVRQDGSRLQLVGMGVLQPPAKAPLVERLAFLHAALLERLAEHGPDLVGLEAVFHGPNTRTLVTLGQARGALMAAVGQAGLPLEELSPAEIKKAVTGRGGARKEQVSHMVGALLGARGPEVAAAGLDATDALAVAIAVLHRRGRAGLGALAAR